MCHTRETGPAIVWQGGAVSPSPRSITLRPITPADHSFVLELNERNVELLAPMDESRLLQLIGWTDRADLVVVDDSPAGFVLTFAAGTAYDSENYRWFTERFGGDFYYLDRIVLDERFRRMGLGAFVYDALEERAASYSRMVLEVNSEPPNLPSLAFHERRGYVAVGELGDAKRVRLMSLELRGHRR
ncbi:GNAT family N-acetyltransferase [Nocardioides sp.]|uniref:GNAT family N-acetyltransferase n=1 Tax=Nocardioides sp. TaxID=35761 RepID=UPI0027361F5C|nr:GNAT family N-acetyltransferase [Nocardioides sp.]MDP3892057.1 GNAT family N-acetyltransferase [Nocardioides sp.]